MPLDLTPLKSSMLNGYHYDPATQLLTVEYGSGGRYQHADVPGGHIENFQKADSPGAFFNAHIKPHFPAVPVGEER